MFVHQRLHRTEQRIAGGPVARRAAAHQVADRDEAERLMRGHMRLHELMLAAVHLPLRRVVDRVDEPHRAARAELLAGGCRLASAAAGSTGSAIALAYGATT